MPPRIHNKRILNEADANAANLALASKKRGAEKSDKQQLAKENIQAVESKKDPVRPSSHKKGSKG